MCLERARVCVCDITFPAKQYRQAEKTKFVGEIKRFEDQLFIGRVHTYTHVQTLLPYCSLLQSLVYNVVGNI